VEEWTRDEIGVGAAMAAGNQAEKGTCALFVILPINKMMINIILNEVMNSVENVPLAMKKNKIHRNKESPSRLVKMVIILEDSLFLLS
jgi:hypothetical protein